MKHLRASGLLLIFLSTIAAETPLIPRAHGTSYTAVEDAYVDNGSPNSNFGTSTRLKIDTGPTIKRIFIRFSLTSTPSPVSSAQLRLTCTNGSPDGGTVWTISGSWTEKGITWSNQPTLVGPVFSIGRVSCSGSGTIVEYDVSTIITGDGTYNFALATNSGDGTTFRSRENGSGPKIVINEAPASGGSPDVDQIHLSWTEDPGTTVTVLWHTASSSNPAKVQYGTTTSYGSSATGKTYASTGPGYLHEVTLRNLTPGTRYNYRASADDGSWSSIHTFSTAPSGDGDFRFLAAADMGTTSNSAVVSNAMAARSPSFAVGAGDYWYSSCTDEGDVDDWFNMNQALFSQAPFMPARGNHEGGNHETDCADRFPTRFALPSPENYYSFRYGGAHFLIVDTNLGYGRGSQQRNFIESNLQSASSDPYVKWTFAVFHHPPFSTTTFEDTTARSELSPLFDRYGVDVVITGHAHVYERTFPVRADGTVLSRNLSEYTNPGAPIYMVTGGGGASPYPGDIKCGSSEPWSAKCVEVFEFLEFRVTGTEILLSATDKNSQVFDTFALRRDQPPPPGQTLTFAPTDDAYVTADSPDTNFGSATTLQVDNSPVKNFLIKFSVTGTGTSKVTSAGLRLFVVDPSDSGGDFYLAVATWNEGTVTWNNAPGITGNIVASLGSVSSGVWYEVDITSIVTGDGIVSIRVISRSSNGADYSSSEGTNAPQLIVAIS